MPDSPLPASPDLAPITADYDVVGELGSESTARMLIATRKSGAGSRRDDDGRVLIEIVGEPKGDEAHALEHLAADAKTLSGLRHRRLVPTLEGRWLGADAFAVIRERVDDPSVAELLAQGETFTNTRTAAILREVHGLLEWAREQNIIHRNVSPARIYLEPVSDRVRVAFAVGPIPRVRSSEASTDDALSIVRLAVSMLTGQLDVAQEGGLSLGDLRPDLPERLLEETATLLEHPKVGIDVPSYLALIGMADPVAEGETERDRIRAEVLEEQRVEREKLANERLEFEKQSEVERRALAAEGEELRRIFAEEKAALEKEFAEAQQAIAAERVRMQRILADERAALVVKQEELERDLATQREVLDRAAAADRASIDELRARIRVAGELEIERKRAMALEEIHDAVITSETGEMAAPAFVRPYIASLDKISFRSNDPLATERVRRAAKLPESKRLDEAVEELKAPRRKPIIWRQWLIPTAIAASVIVTATVAIAIEKRAPTASVAPYVRKSNAVTPTTTTATTTGAMARPVPSSAAPARPAVTYIRSSEVEVAAARVWLDSVRRAQPMDMQWAILQSEAATRRFERTRAAAGGASGAIVADSAARARARARAVFRPIRGQERDTVVTPDSTAVPAEP